LLWETVVILSTIRREALRSPLRSDGATGKWPGHIKPGTVNMDMWSHMDWWPTFAKLAGLEPPPHDWKDNDGNPIIFDGIDLSESLLGTRPGKRDNFIYFNDQSFGGVRVKNFKALYTAKDTWLGQEQSLKIPALYDLWWDPGENYDIVFNGAAPTRGDFKTSPGRYSGQDNGWIGLYINPVTMQFWDEMKTHPNILQAVRCGLLRADSVSLPLAVPAAV